MKVRLPVVIKDSETSRFLDMEPVEEFFYESEDVFLDGPVIRRVAVLDFDPETGMLSEPVPFLAAQGTQRLGRYKVGEESKKRPDIHDINFLKVSAFATVLKTMAMFEGPDTLGRRVVWAFGSPQLFIVPRAGQWSNAYYERDSHSLQFFSFPSLRDSSRTVHTCLSHDIVAHETGHAILDGIAPDLYDAIAPQSLAIHEAVADLVALLMAFRCNTLRRTVLDANRGSIDDTSSFSGIGEEFARARDPFGHQLYLRNLRNQKNLDPADHVNRVQRTEPHALSEVLSGALYAVMLKIHARMRGEVARKRGTSEFSASGEALAIGADRFKRMILRGARLSSSGRGLVRRLWAGDPSRGSGRTPRRGPRRDWIIEEFVRRKIVDDASELQITTNQHADELADVDLRTLIDSDWVAYEFANRNRAYLGVPSGIPFQVRPRLDVTKLYYRRGGSREVREILFKVSWNHSEPNPVRRGLPAKRQITVGTMLAIDPETRAIRAKLTSDLGAAQCADRDQLLSSLVEEGLVRFGRDAIGPDGQPLRSVLKAEFMDGLMRVFGTARLLHIVGDLP